MTEYIVAHLVDKSSITPSFNEAAAKLQANKDVKIIDSFNFVGKGAFLIEATEKAIRQVKKDLPGWSVAPNQSIKLID